MVIGCKYRCELIVVESWGRALHAVVEHGKVVEHDLSALGLTYWRMDVVAVVVVGTRVTITNSFDSL